MKIVDLSKPIAYNKKDPWFMRVKIKHKSHRASKWLIRVLGLPFRLFPKNFEGWADDCIQKMGVHATTHMDAPWHYSPTVGDAPAKTIDQIPLEWCFGEGLVIDMSHKLDDEEIMLEEVKCFIDDHDLVVKEGMIVLFRTGRDKYIGQSDYHKHGVGVSAAVTEWLIDLGIKVMGIDAWGWDLPLPHLIERAKETNDPDLFWNAHLVGQRKEYCHMEQMVNLGSLPLSGFKVAAFPLKIVGASAGPARVVAIIE
ncbi:cyclase family protein [Halosquirtibacter xylanolyticus]|uniref:cyclase family protein n=1 Tax=Halosquirtibacter xylanolyticus TaxID=3374599 RepID=UPI0037480CDD|nr:cyclase family protein [Prolixibacteraceae bacterium]